MSKQFKVGDRVTSNEMCRAKGFTAGVPYEVVKVTGTPARPYLHFRRDDKGCTYRFRPASEFDAYAEASAPAEEKRATFKVGDKVRIVRKFDGGGVLYWADYYMDKYVGREGVVTSTNSDQVFAVSVDGDVWCYMSESLELVSAAIAYKIVSHAPRRHAAVWAETYQSIEAAREAIIKSGRRGVSYEILPYNVAETVRLVETTKRSLEAA